MVRAARFICLGIALAMSALSPAQASETQHDWSAIGQLTIEGHRDCTATLIRRDVIVTAAHCFVDGNMAPWPVADMRFDLFHPSMNRTVSFGVTQVAVHLDYDPGRSVYDDNIAFVMLDGDAEDMGFQPFGYGNDTDTAGGILMVAAAEVTDPTAPAVSSCELIKNAYSPRLWTCENAQLSGGAPLFWIAETGEPRIIAINVAHGTASGQPVLIGTNVRLHAPGLLVSLGLDPGPSRSGGTQQFHRAGERRDIGARFTPAFRSDDQ